MGAKKYAFNCVVFHPGEEKKQGSPNLLGVRDLLLSDFFSAY